MNILETKLFKYNGYEPDSVYGFVITQGSDFAFFDFQETRKEIPEIFYGNKDRTKELIFSENEITRSPFYAYDKDKWILIETKELPEIKDIKEFLNRYFPEYMI